MKIKTKKQYDETLIDLINEISTRAKNNAALVIYKLILDQLNFIDKVLLKERRPLSESEYGKLSLGAIAVKNFDSDNDPYAIKLCEIYGNADIYFNLM